MELSKTFVSVVFTQFPKNSQWHLLRLPEHLDYPMPLDFGGFLGGIRKLEGRNLAEMKMHLANEPRFY